MRRFVVWPSLMIALGLIVACQVRELPIVAPAASLPVAVVNRPVDVGPSRRRSWFPPGKTETRTVTVTECRPETRERTVTVYKRVPETKTVERTCTVMVPETRTRKVEYCVQVPVTREVTEEYTVCVPKYEDVTREYQVKVPVWTEKECEYTVMVPHQETREGTCRVVKCVPVTETRNRLS